MRRKPHAPTVPPLLTLCLLSLSYLVLGACGGTEGPPEPDTQAEPRRISNARVGIDLVGLPEGFRLVSHEGAEIVLERKPELPPGTAVITAEEPAGNVNLVAAVNEQATAIEERPGGSFQGQTELGSHFGPAYLTRGRWAEEGSEKEEMKLFSLHPESSRLLVITYTYPLTGDTKDRATQIMDVLASLEAPAADTGKDSTPEEDLTTREGTDVGNP